MSFNKLLISIFIFVSCDIFSQSFGVGSYSRMGTSATNIANGNATSSNIKFLNDGFSNPAILPFLQNPEFTATNNFLSLDRNLFSLSFSTNIKPKAGISLTTIIANTNNIDGRDRDGFFIENYSTTEQQYILSFGNRFTDKLSIGINTKIFYTKLFEDLSSTTVGFDFGTFYKFNETTFLAFVIKDLNSSYKWDTSNLYNENGNSTVSEFPVINRFSITKLFFENKFSVSFEIEKISSSLLYRTGANYELIPELTFFAGVDRIIFEKNNTATINAGFLLKSDKFLKNFSLAYAYATEPFNLFNRQIISFNYKL